jgi:hypothetical protein
LATELNPFDQQTGVEAAQVVDIARHDDGSLATPDKNHGRIDDVGRASTTAEDARRLGEHLVERGHRRRWSFHEGAQRRLASAGSPDLPEGSGWDDEAHARGERRANERAHMRVASLERDEGTGV